MKTREVTLFTGVTLTVPQGIQRIDTKATHGWQVRYNGTKFIKDGGSDGANAEASLRTATRELFKRIATSPAPVTLKRGPSAHKSSDLPAGISGPIRKQRGASAVPSAVLSVLLPRFGQEPQVKTVYIGSLHTYTIERYEAALARAVEMRAQAIARYELTATRTRRKQANQLKSELRSARAA